MANPLIPVMKKLQDEFFGQLWPVNAESEVQALYCASSPVVSELANAATLTRSLSASTWASKTASDLSTWIADVGLANHDLGICPPF